MIDHGDGTYSLAIVSTTPGTAWMAFTVEGSTVVDQPILTYELVGPSVCGDGFVDTSAGEVCDDANLSDLDACLNDCQPATCGDGVVQQGVEQCDGGTGCAPDCTFETCGDNGSILQCDDSNGVLVILTNLQGIVDGDPTSDLAAALGPVIDELWDAYVALNATPVDALAARTSLENAYDGLDAANAAGLSWWDTTRLRIQLWLIHDGL